MKLPRPYIPLSVRITVARRQLMETGWIETGLDFNSSNKQAYLNRLLYLLFVWQQPNNKPISVTTHLDHDPPLCLREYNPKTKQYVPDANDPNHLTYIKAESHRVKTFIKGEGARRSDMGQRRYLKRVIARRNPKPRFKPRAAKHIRRVSHASVTTKDGGAIE